jgi:hypothetical protein
VTQYVVEVSGLQLRVVKTGLPDPELRDQAKASVGIRGGQILVLDKLSSSETASVERTILGA